MDQINPKIEVEYEKNATITKLRDTRILDQADIQALEESIIPLIEASDSINLIIDFSNVQFLTSAVLGLLIRVSKKVYESEGQLRLCAIDNKILEIFRITRLDRVFDIHEDRYEALRSLE